MSICVSVYNRRLVLNKLLKIVTEVPSIKMGLGVLVAIGTHPYLELGFYIVVVLISDCLCYLISLFIFVH